MGLKIDEYEDKFLDRVLLFLNRTLEILIAFMMGMILVVIMQILLPGEKMSKLTVVLVIAGTCVACLVYARIWNFLYGKRVLNS